MKHFFLIALIIVCSPAWAQEVVLPAPFEFRLIDSVSGTKSELYIRARAWMANTYNSSQDVLQMDDKEAGKIIGKAITTWPIKGGFGNLLCESPIHYTITIDIKDGKYRCVLGGFYHKGCFTGKVTTMDGGDLNNNKPEGSIWSGGLTASQWQKLRLKAAHDAELILLSLKGTMHNEGSVKASNDGF